MFFLPERFYCIGARMVCAQGKYKVGPFRVCGVGSEVSGHAVLQRCDIREVCSTKACGGQLDLFLFKGSDSVKVKS